MTAILGLGEVVAESIGADVHAVALVSIYSDTSINRFSVVTRKQGSAGFLSRISTTLPGTRSQVFLNPKAQPPRDLLIIALHP